jgi:N-acetyl sugar amidotransferase
MRTCTNGVWNETVPGITFDSDGVSNFCDLQTQMMNEYPRGSIGQKKWTELIAKIKMSRKRNSNYDCVVGISGGVDSSYLLVLLKEAGLKPLAVNLDNGFNSEIAVKNIFKMTDALDIDLETYVIDYEEIKDLLRSYIKSGLPWIDTPTDMAIKSVMYKIALQENVKYIIRGNDFRSEGKQPKEWTYSDSKQLNYIRRKYGKSQRLKSYPQLSYKTMIYAALLKGIKDVRPFYYLEYSKQAAKKELMEQYDWKDYGGHHHENIFTKFCMGYWLPRKFNIDKRVINLSAQVLSGMINREDAISMLEKPALESNEADQLKLYILKKLDFDENDFDIIWDAPNKSIYDYPSSYSLIMYLSKLFSPIIRYIYDFKPMALSANEKNI